MVEQIIKMYEIPKPIIFVDKRETASGIINEFKKFDCVVKETILKIADFLCSDRVAIERKTEADFIKSIMDMRLFAQLKELRNNFEKPILVIEGSNDFVNVKPNVIRGALASIALDYGMPLIWTKNIEETAGLIFWIAKREQLQEKREAVIRGEKKVDTESEKQEFLIAGLPNINSLRAKSLLKYFKTPEAVFTADENELSKADGIGKKTAQSIKDLLKKEYRS